VRGVLDALAGLAASDPRGPASRARVVVVNDGCTDATPAVLAAFPEVVVVDHGVNRGKGEALVTGFAYARATGYSHVITIDTDGQHAPSDLGAFLSAIARAPRTLWLGDRGLLSRRSVENAPGSSVFGCRFSNFWVRLETGLALTDTQTGYRAYPVDGLPQGPLAARRYDFEIEIIVRAAWMGTPVAMVPISVHYPPRAERISHFHPWGDNARLTRLHTRLCTERIFTVLGLGRLFRLLFAPDHPHAKVAP
jgi:glycosyltransferase involved in cell wall biosynthesis